MTIVTLVPRAGLVHSICSWSTAARLHLSNMYHDNVKPERNSPLQFLYFPFTESTRRAVNITWTDSV
jgi:hypothetical protein